MRQFFKWVLAVIVGLLIWGIVKLVMLMIMMGSMATSFPGNGSAPALPKEGVLSMDLGAISISEQTRQELPSLVNTIQGGNEISEVGLMDAVNALHSAAKDPGIKFLFIKTDNLVTGLTKLEELRKAIVDFRKGGKAVICYGESFTSGSYYIASVADKIYTTAHHGGNNFFLGISGRMLFLKDLLDKLGVNYQLIRHGKYKSAGETYIKNTPSPENMEQNQAMIDSMWETVAEETAQSRGISVDSLNYFIENLSIGLPEDMLSHGLADEALSAEGLEDKLALLAGKEKIEDVAFISFVDYAAAKAAKKSFSRKKIAVIYADGNIVEQEDPSNICGETFARILAKVRADSTVKAVVLRVNSPGGTVLAANKIKEGVDLTRAVKPVIASYGDYAASGGYWISNSCDHIFSNATTLTGSIGVFSAIPEFSGTLKNIAHINLAPVNSHKHSDMLSLTRPFDSEEIARMQMYVDDIYEEFVNIVAEGRDKAPEYVDGIAQGRVWTGADGLKIGLVDEIGTLEDAIAYAAAVAGDPDVKNWTIAGYPKPLSAMEKLLRQFGKGAGGEEVLATAFDGTPLEDAARALINWKNTWAETGNGALVFARMPYEISIR